MKRIVFATRNEGKIVELADLLRGSHWRVERLPREIEEYRETAETFAENARGKALFAAALLDAPVLADDSGLEIDALGGAPGVRSARYIDAKLTAAERNAAILDKMRAVPAAARAARFRCHLALACGDAIVHETTGSCEGVITGAAHGDGGFGYDPIFRATDLDATFAEISREQKSQRSHRGRAVRSMTTFLHRWEPIPAVPPSRPE